LGRARPECSLPPAEASGALALLGVALGHVDGQADDEGDCQLADGWVAGVGSGRKDEANLVGYWRFSEGEAAQPLELTEGDEGIKGTEALLVCPGAFEDLSGCDVAATVMGSLALAPCSCSRLDEGDEGSTRVAHDLVFTCDTTEAAAGDGLRRGLVVDCARGGPLDVGLAHTDPLRSMLTVEAWVMVPHAEDTSGGGGGGGGGEDVVVDDDDDDEAVRPFPFDRAQTLLTRRVSPRGSDNDDAGSVVWSLEARPDGSLAVRVGSDPAATAATGRGALKAGKWAHLALELSTRNSLVPWDNAKKAPSAARQTCEAALMVDGEQALEQADQASPLTPTCLEAASPSGAPASANRCQTITILHIFPRVEPCACPSLCPRPPPRLLTLAAWGGLSSGTTSLTTAESRSCAFGRALARYPMCAAPWTTTWLRHRSGK